MASPATSLGWSTGWEVRLQALGGKYHPGQEGVSLCWMKPKFKSWLLLSQAVISVGSNDTLLGMGSENREAGLFLTL